MKITVYKLTPLHTPKYLTFEGGHRYDVKEAWAVKHDGERTHFVVVDAHYGLVFGQRVEGNDVHALSAWHAGISPGDLARRQQ